MEGRCNNTIIEQIAREKIVETIVDNLGVSELYRDDLVQELYLILLEYDPIIIREMWERNEIRFFIARVASNQYNSKTSPFFRDYKKYNQKKDGNKIDPAVLEDDDE